MQCQLEEAPPAARHENQVVRVMGEEEATATTTAPIAHLANHADALVAEVGVAVVAAVAAVTIAMTG